VSFQPAGVRASTAVKRLRSVPRLPRSTWTVAMTWAVPARVSSSVTARSVTVPVAETWALVTFCRSCADVRRSSSRSAPVEASSQRPSPASSCRGSRVLSVAISCRPAR
jgi:hypothetical protein